MSRQDEPSTEVELPDWTETIGEFVKEYAPKIAFLPALFAVVSLATPIENLREWGTRTTYGKLRLFLGLPLDVVIFATGVALGLLTLALCIPSYAADKIPEVQPAIYKDGVENE